MQYHLTLTQRCNLNCNYCGATVEPEIMPVNLDYSISALVKFVEKDNEDPVLAFYGGEPTINFQKIIEIMDQIPNGIYCLQTNATLLHRIPASYLKRFNSILLSIDGDRHLTDYYRGKGVYSKIIAEGVQLRESGFTGDLIARMTVTLETDIFKEVTHLIELKKLDFDHVHWQLDVMWDTDYNEKYSEISQWIIQSYNQGITKLVKYWVNELCETGKILGIAPFLGITHTLITGEKSNLRCGAGKDFFAITTDGKITMCPILPSYEFVIGDIFETNPKELVDKITLDEPCKSCYVKDVCGGRCLYTNKTKFWGEEGFNLICSTVKHLISEIRIQLPRINEAINTFNLEIIDFKYPIIPNGVEVIP